MGTPWIVLLSFAGVLLLLSAVYLLVLVRPRARRGGEALLRNYAHRGLHGGGVPENSMAAFRRAVEAGYGIELDVHLSRDGEVVVFHDETLVRMTGCERRLAELTLDELRSLSLAGTDETIPTLAEVLSLVAGRVPILVELKGESTSTALCEKVAAQMRTYEGDYCFESFNPLLVRRIQKYLPRAYCGQLYTNVCREKGKRTLLYAALTAMAFNFLAHPDFIAYDQKERDSLPVRITTRLYRAARFVWTARTEEERETARALGEHAIFELGGEET
jgi:glycerophosphoryl diester phosphodiesterase